MRIFGTVTAGNRNGTVPITKEMATLDNELLLHEKAVVQPAEPEDTAVLVPTARDRSRNGLLVGAEVVLALAASLGLALWSFSVNVNPLIRIGQVSGLAGLQLRFVVIGIAMIAVAMIIVRLRGSALVPAVTRLGCAVMAGLSSGFLAGGSALALRGTNLPFFGTMAGGDFATIVKWAQSIQRGHSTLQPFYPPAPVYVLTWWSDLTGTNVQFAFKDLELVGAGLFGPVAYLSWRLLLRPLPALAIGVVSALPLVELYKPYESLVLIALVPLLAKLLQTVRTAPQHSYPRLLLVGVLFGAALGICFLSYSGWFVWSAPGFVVALLIMLPWRRGFGRALVLVGATVVVLGGLCLQQIISLINASASVKDTYFYFDTTVDPAYVAMSRGPYPGNVGLWPPPGELGGVGLFTVVLCAGLAAALFLGLRNAIVITATCCLAGAWLMRFYYASMMYQQHAVQLYPRTTTEIIYCLVLLTLFAALLAWERLKQSSATVQRMTTHAMSSRTLPAGLIGAFCALLLLVGSAASATVDNYLPRNDNSMGHLAWVGQSSRMPNGHCSIYLQANCKTIVGTHPPVPKKPTPADPTKPSGK